MSEETNLDVIRNNFASLNGVIDDVVKLSKDTNMEETEKVMNSAKSFIGSVCSILNSMGDVQQYTKGDDGKGVSDKIRTLKQRIPSDITGIVEILADISSNTEDLKSIEDKLRIGEEFNEIVSYKDKKDKDGKIISVSTYEKIFSKNPFVALNEYTPNTKSTSSSVSIELAANYVGSVVKSLSKISGISAGVIRKTNRRISLLRKVLPETFSQMKNMISDINSEFGDANSVKKLIGWNEGKGTEFVTYEATDDITGKKYLKILETTKKESWGNTTEKVKNLEYVKPHYEAENGLFLVGDYISKLVGSVDKLTSFDPLTIRKKAIRFRMGIKPMMKMLKMAVSELTSQLGSATVDPATIEFLIGSEKSEENYINTISRSSNGDGSGRSDESHATKKITDKKAGLLDVTARVFDIIDRIVNFPFDDNIKKLAKFRIKSGILGVVVRGSIVSLVGTVSDVNKKIGTEFGIGKDASKEEIDKKLADTTDTLIHFLGKDGVQGVFDLLVKVSDSYMYIAKKVGGSKMSRFISKKMGVESDNDVVTNFIDTCLRVITHMSKNKKLTEKDFKKANDNAKQISGVMSIMIPTALAFRALQIISLAGKNTKGNNVKRMFEAMVNSVSSLQEVGKLDDARYNAVTLLAVFTSMIPLALEYQILSVLAIGAGRENKVKLLTTNIVESVEVFGEKKKEISDSRNGIFQLVAAVASIAALILFVIKPIGEKPEETTVGLAMMGMVSFGSVKIFEKISQSTEIVKEGAKTLLFIAGSFMLFSLSILVLGLVNENVWKVLGAFIIVVGAAVGILALLTILEKPVDKGVETLMFIALSFLAFTGVIALMSLVAESIDFLGLLSMVGIIALMVGVGALAGLASPLLIIGGIALGVLSIGLFAMLLAMYMVTKLGDIEDINKSMDKAMEGVKSIVTAVASIPVRSLTSAMVKSVELRLLMCNVASVMRILSKIGARKVPVSWDKDGNVTKWESLDTTKVTSITGIVKEMVRQVNAIAEELTRDGSLDAKTLRSAKRRARVMKKMMRHVSGMMKFIVSLSNGPLEYGAVDENGELVKGTGGTIKGSLGDYLKSHKKQIVDNVGTMMEIMNLVAEKVCEPVKIKSEDGSELTGGMASHSVRDMRRAKRKSRNISRIVNLINPIIDLIKSLSDGQYNIGTDDKPQMVNLGEYISSQRGPITANLTALFDLVQHIGEQANRLNGTDKNGKEEMSKKDLKKARRKVGLIGGVLETISSTLDIINDLAMGEVQIGEEKDGSPITENMSEFLSKNEQKIYDNLDTLFGFITGSNGNKGIQQYIDGLVGTKGKDADNKQNSMEIIQGMTDVINSIIDMSKSLGDAIEDNKTKDLFGNDGEKNLKGRLASIMEAYETPLSSESVFAKEDAFKKRFKNLTAYEKLMKKIIEVKNVDNFEKSVRATGDMVNSINSINDSKIDKLNQLMKNMTEFGKTVDEALKDTFDKITELAEELHYIIDAKENNGNNSKVSGSGTKETGSKDTKPVLQTGTAPVQNSTVTKVDMSTVEDYLLQIRNLVDEMKKSIRY